MHVAMEKPVAQRVAQEQLQHPRGQGPPVMPGGINRGHIGGANPLGPLQRHDTPGGQVPFDLWHLKPCIFCRIGGKFGGGRAFQPQVQLAQNHAFEMGDHIHRAQAAGRGRQQFDHPGGEIECVEILAERFFNTRAQHLDRNLFARIDQHGFVHLRQRRRRNRGGKAAEHLADGHAQLTLDLGLGHVNRERGQLVLQHAQLHRQLVAHHIGARRQHLSELDVGRSQRRQGPGRRGQIGIAAIAQPFERPGKSPGNGAQSRPRVKRIQHNIHRTRAFQRGSGPDQPPDIMRTSQSFQPECNAATPRVRLRYLELPNPARRTMPKNVSWSGNLRMDSTRY